MLHQIKAQQFYTDLGLQKIVGFKDFSRLLSDFPVLFKADSIFNFQKNPLDSSTFQACENPDLDRVLFNIYVLCMLGNFPCFCCRLQTFLRSTFFKKFFRECYQSVKKKGSFEHPRYILKLMGQKTLQFYTQILNAYLD